MTKPFKWEPIKAKPVVPQPQPQPEAPKYVPLPDVPPAFGLPYSDAKPKMVPLWVAVALGCLCMFLLAVQFRGCIPDIIPIDGGGNWPHEKIDGIAMLVFEDESDVPRRDYEPGQVAALMDLRNWAEKNVMEVDGTPAYLNLDAGADWGRLDELWSQMRDELTLDPPCVGVLSGDNFIEFEVPETRDGVEKALKRIK